MCHKWVTSGLFCGSLSQMSQQVWPTFNPVVQFVKTSRLTSISLLNIPFEMLSELMCGLFGNQNCISESIAMSPLFTVVLLLPLAHYNIARIVYYQSQTFPTDLFWATIVTIIQTICNLWCDYQIVSRQALMILWILLLEGTSIIECYVVKIIITKKIVRLCK